MQPDEPKRVPVHSATNGLPGRERDSSRTPLFPPSRPSDRKRRLPLVALPAPPVPFPVFRGRSRSFSGAEKAASPRSFRKSPPFYRLRKKSRPTTGPAFRHRNPSAEAVRSKRKAIKKGFRKPGNPAIALKSIALPIEYADYCRSWAGFCFSITCTLRNPPMRSKARTSRIPVRRGRARPA